MAEGGLAHSPRGKEKLSVPTEKALTLALEPQVSSCLPLLKLRRPTQAAQRAGPRVLSSSTRAVWAQVWPPQAQVAEQLGATSCAGTRAHTEPGAGHEGGYSL